MSKNVVWIVAAALVLVACSGRRSETTVPGADLITGVDGGAQVPGVTMTLTPPTLRTCEHPDGRMVVNASWDARAAGASSVTIWVSDANSKEAKRFFHGGVVGNADTGPWAADGLVFRIEDGDKVGRTLITRTLHAVTCMAESSSVASGKIYVDPATVQ